MKPSVLRAAGYAALALLAAGIAHAQIVTTQYDNQRTGATLSEKTLAPQNVNVRQFGKLGAFKVDGAVYALPSSAGNSRQGQTQRAVCGHRTR